MLKKAIIFSILALLVAGCSSGPDDYFKRSANNKIFDRKGFQNSKRPPLYNKKYIAQAKKNILNGDYNDDEAEDEVEDPSYDNIEMYKAMIEEDLNDMNQKNRRRKKSNRSVYPSIVDANDKISVEDQSSNLELREEITQIKSMLDDARRELASYKCPATKELEENSIKEQTPTPSKNQSQKTKTTPKDQASRTSTTSSQSNNSENSSYTDEETDSTVIDPVSSI
jgi:hypothetical protein